MRCKSCLEIFSQPSSATKKTRICSICRGVKTKLKGHRGTKCNLKIVQYAKNNRIMSKICNDIEKTSNGYNEKDKSHYYLDLGIRDKRNLATKRIENIQ